MAERNLARYLAPLALVAFVVAAIIVVTGSTSDDGGRAASNGGDRGSTTATTTRAKKGERPKKFYRVKEGDLLSTISEKTGIATENLIELNPDLDPQALQTGQLVRLRR